MYEHFQSWVKLLTTRGRAAAIFSAIADSDKQETITTLRTQSLLSLTTLILMADQLVSTEQAVDVCILRLTLFFPVRRYAFCLCRFQARAIANP